MLGHSCLNETIDQVAKVPTIDGTFLDIKRTKTDAYNKFRILE